MWRRHHDIQLYFRRIPAFVVRRIHFLFTVENLGNESAMKLAGARLSRSFTRLRCRLRVSQAVGD